MLKQQYKNTLLMLWIMIASIALVGCGQKEEPVNRSVSVLNADGGSQFAPVVPGRTFSFPQDHLPHPEFRSEWWYLTANVESEDGEQFGIQWTLFRSAASAEKGTGWNNPQRYMAHVVVTGAEKMWAAERFARGGIGQAGVMGHPFKAWLDNWQWHSFSDSPFPAVVSFSDIGMQANLRVKQQGNWVLQGDKGYSQKHQTKPIATYYYSAPFLAVDGELVLDGKMFRVSGQGWFDREWSSAGLAGSQLGWDWFSLHLSDGSALMLYQIREKNSRPYYFGSLSWPDGRTEVIDADAIRLTPKSFTTHDDKTYPLNWYVEIPSKGIQLELDAVREEQWLPFVFSYWEGPIVVSGSHTGQGFMELTGY